MIKNLSPKVKLIVWERAEGKCENCGSMFMLQYHHNPPKGMGGTTTIYTPSMVVLLCQICHDDIDVVNKLRRNR